VAIESVTLARARRTPTSPSTAAGFAWSEGAGAYQGPDGFVDERNGLIDFFGVLKNLGAPRDQMRQSILDLGSLVGVLRDPALDLGPLTLAVPGARLDPDHIAYAAITGRHHRGVRGGRSGTSRPRAQRRGRGHPACVGPFGRADAVAASSTSATARTSRRRTC
jgi:hypothetical protein